MCGRFGQTASGEVLARLLGLDGVPDPPDVPKNINLCPTDPAVVGLALEDGSRAVELMRWGLLPPWAKDKRVAARHINARSETVHTRPAFREAFRERRCLVPTDGFYEWKREGKKRLPFHFGVRDVDAFAMAGLWERWKSPEGEWVRTFTVLTTDANALIAPIHDRMPVILPPAALATWLEPTAGETALRELLGPFPAERMEAWRVSPEINSVRFDGPNAREPLAQLDLFSA